MSRDESDQSRPAPLAGVKVIETASYVSGPFAGLTLADLGAEVIKVEPPRGDPYRRFGRRYGESSLFFRAANQNKSSVALDLQSPDGFAELLEMLADADVLISNWRPNVAPSMGLEPEMIRRDFPRLIWVRVTGYGADGPMAQMPAYDGIVQSRSGVLMSGQEDEPLVANNAVADKVTAMTAAQTVTAALFQRSQTGEGTVADVAMVDAMSYFYGADVSAGHRMVGADPDPEVAIKMGGNAPFRTADSYLTLSPVSGAQIRRCLDAVDRADAWPDIRNAGEQMWEVFSGVMAPPLVDRPTSEWEAIFGDADVPAAAVMTFEQHLNDAQVVHNGTYVDVDDPDLGSFRQVRWPAKLDGEAFDIDRKPAPPQPSAD